MLLDRWRGVFGGRAEEKLFGGELTRQAASAGALLRCRWRGDGNLVGGRERVLTVLEHAHQGQYLFAQALVFVESATQILAQMAQFQLGRVDALVSRLDDAYDLGEVILCWRGFLCRCVGS